MPPYPGPDHADDERLAGALREGSPEAYAQVFEAYGPWLYDYAHTLLRDMDAASDAVCAALCRIGTDGDLSDPYALRAELYRLVRLESTDLAEALQGRPDHGHEASDIVLARSDDPLRLERGRVVVRAALAHLDASGHEVAELTLRHGLDAPELARVLSAPEPQVAARALEVQTTIVERLSECLGRQIEPVHLPTILEVLPFAQLPIDLEYRLRREIEARLSPPEQPSDTPEPPTPPATSGRFARFTRSARQPKQPPSRPVPPEPAAPEAAPQVAQPEAAVPLALPPQGAAPDTASPAVPGPEAATREPTEPVRPTRETAEPVRPTHGTAEPEAATRETTEPEPSAREATDGGERVNGHAVNGHEILNGDVAVWGAPPKSPPAEKTNAASAESPEKSETAEKAEAGDGEPAADRPRTRGDISQGRRVGRWLIAGMITGCGLATVITVGRIPSSEGESLPGHTKVQSDTGSHPIAPSPSTHTIPAPASEPAAASAPIRVPPAPSSPSASQQPGGGGDQQGTGVLMVDDTACRGVLAMGLPGSCTVTLSARSGTVHWAVSSVQSGIARISADGSGTLASGQSTTIQIRVIPTVACYVGGGGNGLVAFSPGGSAAVSYTCSY